MDPVKTSETQKRYDRQAAVYDLTELPMELLGFGRMRRKFWGGISAGHILEIGVGTAKNFSHHPRGARVVGIDVSPKMLARAARRAKRLGRQTRPRSSPATLAGRDVDLILADAQRLPFRDGVFDAAAATFVFCSVPDPVAGLEEARRVVRDGGEVRLLEHVRAGHRLAGWIMDRLNPVAVRLTGANINRDTVSNVARAGIRIDGVETTGLGIVKLIRGSRTQKQAESARPREQAGKAVGSDVSRG